MNKGIYNRGYLPHWDFPTSLQAITFRLADSVPIKVIQKWRCELTSIVDDKERQKELHRRIARYEDAGHGESLLSIPDIARAVQQKLMDGHMSSYKLIAWCIMPNHVHVMIKLNPGSIMAEIVQQWKGASSFEINKALARTGRLWQRDYHDRYIRDMDHFHDSLAYIHNNPVKAGLCEKPDDWPFSSVGRSWNPNGPPASAGNDAPSTKHAD